MRLPQFCVRFPKEMAEEVTRLAKANKLTTEMVRELVGGGIVARAEATTDSQSGDKAFTVSVTADWKIGYDE